MLAGGRASPPAPIGSCAGQPSPLRRTPTDRLGRGRNKRCKKQGALNCKAIRTSSAGELLVSPPLMPPTNVGNSRRHSSYSRRLPTHMQPQVPRLCSPALASSGTLQRRWTRTGREARGTRTRTAWRVWAKVAIKAGEATSSPLGAQATTHPTDPMPASHHPPHGREHYADISELESYRPPRKPS